jgi:hypothetical protein
MMPPPDCRRQKAATHAGNSEKDRSSERERATVRERMQIERETETERPKMQKKKKKKMVPAKRMDFDTGIQISSCALNGEKYE